MNVGRKAPVRVSFFQEAGQLLKHGKGMTFLDIFGEEELDPEEERRADAFARDFLILADYYLTFLANGRSGQSAINAFAAKLGIAPGIVLGRLQFDGHIG